MIDDLSQAFDPVAAVIIGIFLLPVIGVLFKLYLAEKKAKEDIMEKRLSEMREILELSNEAGRIAETLLELTKGDKQPREAFRQDVRNFQARSEAHQGEVQRKLDEIKGKVGA